MSTPSSAREAPFDAGFVACVLEWFPHAVIVVDGASVVTGMNHRAGRLLTSADGLVLRDDVLRCTDTRDTVSLHRLVAAAAEAPPAGHPPRAVRFRRSNGRRPLTAVITATNRDWSARAVRGRVAVIVNDPDSHPMVDEQMLRTWYDLTPAEARVAALLAAGFNLDTIVAHLGVGANTVRTQLKSIFAKTDTRRQGELISLLLGNPTVGLAGFQSYGFPLRNKPHIEANGGDRTDWIHVHHSNE